MLAAAESLEAAAAMIRQGQKKNEEPMRPKAGPAAANQRGAGN
jgi:hypothetical protein